MFDRANIVYRYDGTFDGFLCCVFEAFRNKEEPEAIEPEDAAQETIFPVKYIDSIPENANRVNKSIPQKISHEAMDWVHCVFLSCDERKEVKILRFLEKGFKAGKRITSQMADEDVYNMYKIVRFYGNEAHLSLEFLRFSQYGDFLAAVITPKNNVIPRIVAHFCDRFPSENFIIYDKNRKSAFMHKNTGETTFMEDTEITFPEADENEENYRRLWRLLYKTIENESRRNHANRRNHMPMRYWPNMTEFQGE